MNTSIRPMPPYFIVRVPKKEQQERKDKIGSLYYPPAFAFMKRGMQCGEIVSIGQDAHVNFPAAEIGHFLLFHHFIEHKETKSKSKFFMVDEDDDYNYYAVTGLYHNGDRNLSYGIWDGESLIPNKENIFLFPEVAAKGDVENIDIHVEGMSNLVTNIAFEKASGGIITAKSVKRTREDMIRQMSVNRERIDKISPFMRWREDVVAEVKRLEEENNKISKEINKKRYEPFQIAGINEETQQFFWDAFKCSVGAGDFVYVLNLATHMIIEFQSVEYIVAGTQYIYAPLEWILNCYSKYKDLVAV